MASIWKISHGKNSNISDVDHNKLMNIGYVSQGYAADDERGKNQGQAFHNEIQKGDYFYLVRNGAVVAFGKFADKDPINAPVDISSIVGWPMRKVEFLKSLTKPYASNLVIGQEHWKPQGNTTVKRIDPGNLQEFENVILKPAFGMTLKELNIDAPSTSLSSATKLKCSSALNTILYGPPGTGKTYNTVVEALCILDLVDKEALSKFDHAELKVRFDDYRSKGQIEFVTFHQNYSYEDFMVGLRPQSDGDGLKFYQHKGTFYTIAEKARENYLASKSGARISRKYDDVILELLSPLDKGEAVRISMASGKEFSITKVTDFSLHFEKSNGSTLHTLSLDTLRDWVNEKRTISGGLSSYYKPLVEMIRSLMRTELVQEPAPLKNYVLIIDEINRANISKVFGELITLLEEDKRLGAPSELKVTLPNGENNFSVPPNLYVIGTMNTADKSIALIDIALRRRFQFIGMYPQYDHEKLSSEDKDLLKSINEAIYEKKKSADFLIGHAYFMKDNKTKDVIEQQVIPLLMEYFSGRTDIVASIFENTDWKVSYDSSKYSWNIQGS